jgi:hypothetical protein
MLLCMVADGNRAKAACGRAFASKSALESHVAFVDNSRTCRLCLTELDSMVALKGHTASHFRTGGERGLWLGCPLCSRSYKGINQMVQHMLHHDLPVRDMRLMLAMLMNMMLKYALIVGETNSLPPVVHLSVGREQLRVRRRILPRRKRTQAWRVVRDRR